MTTFSTVIGQINGGTTHQLLTDKLQEITRAVQNTGKAGELTLKLKVRPNGIGIIITDDIKANVPELTRGNSIFFTDANGALLQRDPNQPSLFKEAVNAETGEITKAS